MPLYRHSLAGKRWRRARSERIASLKGSSLGLMGVVILLEPLLLATLPESAHQCPGPVRHEDQANGHGCAHTHTGLRWTSGCFFHPLPPRCLFPDSSTTQINNPSEFLCLISLSTLRTVNHPFASPSRKNKSKSTSGEKERTALPTLPQVFFF